jgi:hypothetical protein
VSTSRFVPERSGWRVVSPSRTHDTLHLARVLIGCGAELADAAIMTFKRIRSDEVDIRL